MSVLSLAVREIRHRFLTFLLGLLAVTSAVALFAAMTTMGRASNAETSRLMRDLGFNVLILPEGSDVASFWASDTIDGDMPEEYVSKLAKTPKMSADHYVGVIQQKVPWQGMQVLLTGVLKEQTAVDARQKAPMGVVIERGTCRVGYSVCRQLGLEEGDAVDVLGKPLTVGRCLAEDGSKEDVRLWAHLADVQDMLGMQGRVNMIQALGCLCSGSSLDRLRDDISKVLPGTYVTELRNLAVARSSTRVMVEEYVGFIMGAVVIVCAAWVGLLALLNVRERRHEIGLLRALGFGSGRIAVLFISRAVLMGLVGAAAGFALGTWLALDYGTEIFKITFKAKPAWDSLVPLLIGAPLLASLASLLPAMVAVTQDPAAVLTEE